MSIIRYWKYLAIHPDRLKQAHPELTAEDALANANDAQASVLEWMAASASIYDEFLKNDRLVSVPML